MRSRYRKVMGFGAALLLSGAGGLGCSSEAKENAGQLSLPLATNGPSGTEYRLRDAEFEIYSYPMWGVAGSGPGPSAGAPAVGGAWQPASIVVSSEDDPAARAISVDVETGSYNVLLRPGWRMERITPEGAETIEATLLSDAWTYVYVWPRSTSFAEYRFGIGERSIWLNGQLNIEIQVSEDPNEGGGGFSGWGAGGSTTAGAPAMGGAAISGGAPGGG